MARSVVSPSPVAPLVRTDDRGVSLDTPVRLSLNFPDVLWRAAGRPLRRVVVGLQRRSTARSTDPERARAHGWQTTLSAELTPTNCRLLARDGPYHVQPHGEGGQLFSGCLSGVWRTRTSTMRNVRSVCRSSGKAASAVAVGVMSGRTKRPPARPGNLPFLSIREAGNRGDEGVTWLTTGGCPLTVTTYASDLVGGVVDGLFRGADGGRDHRAGRSGRSRAGPHLLAAATAAEASG